MSTTALRLGRSGAAAGLVFTVFTIAGNELANRGDAAGDDAGTALANIQRVHGVANHVGTAVELLGFVAFMFFAGYLYRVLRQAEGRTGWLAATVLLTAAVDLAVKLGSGAALVAAYAHPGQLTPELARVLVDLNDGAFVVTGLTMAAFVLATSASGYPGRALPRALVWVGFALGGLGLLTPILGVTDPGGYNPLPYLVSLLWIAALSVLRVVRETRSRAVGSDVPATAVPVG